MNTLLTLDGKTAVVTGGGRGIGAAIARALGAAGAAVVVAARSENEIDGVATELRALGVQAWPVPVDVTDPDSVTKLTSAAIDRMGRVDVLVNNAGGVKSAPLHSQSLEDWNRVIAVNATGTFLCTQSMVAGMVESGWGRVVNIASVTSKVGARYISAYAASKHAVLGFTRSIALELADKGVTVNAICPGYVDTDMTTASLARIEKKTGQGSEQALAMILAGSPQGRLIEPDEIAHLVLALCDHNARGITGQAIVIDGGEVQT